MKCTPFINTLFCTLALFIFCLPSDFLDASVKPGVESLFSSPHKDILRGKKIGLITNQTAIDTKGISTTNILKKYAGEHGYSLVALFAPEHGLTGIDHNGKDTKDGKDRDGIIIYSLNGTVRRPTPAMLGEINLLIYDIQDVGSRSYTHISTLFYAMEEAAKTNIPVIVLDRPNPLGGLLVDGPMLEEKYRSFIGYVNVPYCHGMTIGELAHYFNGEYKIGCNLTVIPMSGWKRHMIFEETELTWIPTSPQIPESRTAFYYPTTGILGQISLVSIGIGYTLPFKVVAAPWIDPIKFSNKLNEQNLPGVYFHPFHYQPFFGAFAKKDCSGVLISITNPHTYLPVTTQYVILGILKSLYPSEFAKAFGKSVTQQHMFHLANGTDKVYRILTEEKYVIWKLRELHKKEREEFLRRRDFYLISQYASPIKKSAKNPTDISK